MNLLPCNVSLLPYGQNDAIISCSRDNVVSQWCVLAVCNWFSANILMQAHSSVNYALSVEFSHCSCAALFWKSCIAWCAGSQRM